MPTANRAPAGKPDSEPLAVRYPADRGSLLLDHRAAVALGDFHLKGTVFRARKPALPCGAAVLEKRAAVGLGDSHLNTAPQTRGDQGYLKLGAHLSQPEVIRAIFLEA